MNKNRNGYLFRAARALRAEIQFYQRLLANPKTPAPAKWCLYLGLAYLLSPFDLIPDFIPVLGQLDDLLVVGGLIWLAKFLTPIEIIEDCRKPAPDPENTAK